MLKEYAKKRNFKRTSEPASKKSRSPKKVADHQPLYVIHEHHASHLHYDLRLESQGVLKSWAVPKGMPTSPTDRRLAIQTEDHPLAYADFKGTIPKGEYGAGKVKIYDKGYFENLTHDKSNKPVSIKAGLTKGHVVFTLHGRRYKSKAYALHRFKRGKKDLWLLLFMENK